MYKPHGKPSQETKELSVYLEALGKGIGLAGDKELADKFARSSQWLYKLSYNVCGGGYVGCHGGDDCSSDHK